MKVSLQCAHCLLDRAIKQTKLATNDPNLQMNVVHEMLKMLGENFGASSVPSHIGTDRDLLVQRMTGQDPYAELKQISNSMALNILSDLQQLVDNEKDEFPRFRKAALIAAAANAIEFDVSGREFSLDDLRAIVDNVEKDLAIDDVEEFYNLSKAAKSVLYLMDNAGEIVLDIILIRELKRLNTEVFAVVKGGPILNDATMEDALSVNLSEHADAVIDTGAAAIGVNRERNSEAFLERLDNAELIIAKGMGNFESMTEFEPLAPTVHIMRTKCDPVATHVGCARDKNVVLIRKP